MDFEDTPAEKAYREEVTAFLEEYAPEEGPEDDSSSIYITDPEAEREYVKRCQDWQKIKYDHGWAGITWPKEYGGRGESSLFDGIFREEEVKLISATGIFSVAIGMTGPTVIAHGTEAQKSQHLSAMLKGEVIWCQLFSEPNAGSDLGGLRTSAVRDGDEWVINGQKVWTSGAQYSDWGILLTRSDPDAPKHKGITYFLVDMNTPGIEVRPLVQITGAAHFNEVFLTDVRIPSENILGEPNAGWGPIMTTLSNERALIGSGSTRFGFEELLDLASSCGVIEKKEVRQELMRSYTRSEILKYLKYRVQTAASQGAQPGPESSIMKLAISLHSYEQGNLTLSMQGAAGMLAEDDALDEGRWQQDFLSQWGVRIGGGTDNIQRNTISEKVLNLPGDIRVDKGVPFKDIPS